jgi:hypothetical protein
MSKNSFKTNKINITSATSALITTPENGDIINESGSLKIYNSSTSSWENLILSSLPSSGTAVEVIFRNQEDFSGQTSTSLIPQYDFFPDSILPQANFSSDVTGIVYDCSFSPNSEFLAVAHATSPYISIYQRNANKFVKLSNPATLPTNDAYGCSWSPNGEFLAVAHAVSPFVTIYQRSGTTFTKLANPATLPTGVGTGCSWSSNGEILVVSHTTSPYITIYQRSGTTFTKLSDPATLPTGNGKTCTFSPNSEFLAVGHTTTPYITIYQRSGTTFTKLANPATLPTGDVEGCSWTPNGELLTLVGSSFFYPVSYQRSGTIFTSINSSLNPTNCRMARFSPNGRIICLASGTSPYLSVTYVSFSRFTNEYPNFVQPFGQCNACSWSSNSEFLAVGFQNNSSNDNSSYLAIYQTGFSTLENQLAYLNKIKRSGT